MKINMNEVVGKSDILFLTLDTLRYDVAESEYLDGNLKNLCKENALFYSSQEFPVNSP